MVGAGSGCVTQIPRDAELPIDGKTGRFSLPWRRWFDAVNARINAAGTDTTALSAEVASLAASVAAIPATSATIRGRDGITVGGTLESGTVTIGYTGASVNQAAVMARISLRC